MRTYRNIMLATTAAVALSAGPALAQDTAQDGDLNCRQEVQNFLQNVRQDDAYPRIEAAFSDYETRLTEALGRTEVNCFAVLGDAQEFLLDRDIEIVGVSDEATVAETERMAEMVAAADATEVQVQAKPAQVGVQQRSADVNVQQGATDVDVAQRAPEVEVRQPASQVQVQPPQQQVDVTQPEAQVDVQAQAPEVDVTQPAPEVQVSQSQPQIDVQQTQPEVTIQQPEPEVRIRQFKPEVEITQPQPTISVEQQKPDVNVVQPQPEVEVEAAQPQVQVSQAQPNVEVDQAQPEIQVTQRQPEVAVTQPDAQVQVEETQPQVDVSQGQPQVQVSQAQPQVDVNQARPEVSVQQGQPEVAVNQASPQVSAEIAEGADVTTSREQTAADVSVEQEEQATVNVAETGPADVTIMSEADMAAIDGEQLTGLEAIAVRELEFAFDSAEVRESAREDVLVDIAERMEETDNGMILLTGYASPIGDADYNLQLAEDRVEAVRASLEEMGVSGSAIRTRALGEDNTEVPAGEDEMSEENRRVEIRLLSASELNDQA